MTQLSVNLNKVALVRNSRGKNLPNLLRVATDLIGMGVRGITLHPRPDERHARRTDVVAMQELLQEYPNVELNIEGLPSSDFLELAELVRPHQVTLVPDAPEAITSNAGWDVGPNEAFLTTVCKQLAEWQVRISVFMDPAAYHFEELRFLHGIGVSRIELYTERFAETFGRPEAEAVLRTYLQLAEDARKVKLGVNAGHDLNLANLGALIKSINWIDEVSIGHALFVEALYLGFEETIRRYLAVLRGEVVKPVRF